MFRDDIHADSQFPLQPPTVFNSSNHRLPNGNAAATAPQGEPCQNKGVHFQDLPSP
jgi:hypothetical protein